MVRRLHVAPVTSEKDFSPEDRAVVAPREAKGLTVVSHRAYAEYAGQSAAKQAPDIVLLGYKQAWRCERSS